MNDQRSTRPASGETTTHAAWGAGAPRLIVTREDSRSEVRLKDDVTRIGSGADADIRLDGIGATAAEVFHDEADEYVFIPHESGETNARLRPMDTARGQDGEVLRTGARFTLGDWTFVYMRDEYADHGRPYGGREGGEGSGEPAQPERPDYPIETKDAPTDEE
ncbi:FHA domain-containing protein [Microbacterium elymi]|jgi:hypothetical protein|uniref:FHA domain-containing protein n=1 Tax=Microbacterium elymi TaxID=2909587 RepID=A0ABY5NM59_9MICO|nr:FHA domain-containing protein [Microbacterium elymi]UUT36268.1 hypothetical protein L2X98_25150 [Microbacterium elymi]